MNKELSNFAARLREMISYSGSIGGQRFGSLALELFGLQFKHNSAYRKISEARKLTPPTIEHWTRIPFVPASSFKELELTSLALNERTTVFHSSGTTVQNPSRHFHNAESLRLYETSLSNWFSKNCGLPIADRKLICLTPPPEQSPHSSLVHMLETIHRMAGGAGGRSEFLGKVIKDGAWTLDFAAALAALSDSQSAIHNPPLILGTAFSFVHLLDYLAENNLKFKLPAGSRLVETGGYKNRSRSMPKSELHALIAEFLAVPRENIICEYGMSELSSQAYATSSGAFQFPPWARAQITSPETGSEVADGETGLIRILDLANVFSVAAIQTEDLAIRRGDKFELIGRAQLAEPRGCSLPSA